MLLVLFTKAQPNLTLYQMNSVAQSNLLNPANTPRQGFTLGLFDMYSMQYLPGITMYDIFRKDESKFTTIDKLLSNSDYHLRDIQFNSEINPLLLGLRIRKNYFTFGIQNSINNSFSLPKDVFSLFYYGNGTESKLFQQPISLSSLDIEMSAYSSLYASYTREFGEKLSIGFRAKYNIGYYHAKTLYNQTSFISDSGENNAIRLTAETNYELQGAGIDRIEALTKERDAKKQMNLMMTFLDKPVGSGYSFDLGINYKPTKKLSLSASVLDIGTMTWSEGKTYSNKSKFVYEGIVTDDPSSIDTTTFKNLTDSIIEIFKPTQKTGSYSIAFNPKFYVGMHYQLYKSGALGLVGYAELWRGNMNYAAAVSFTQRVWKILELKTNYNIYKDQNTNVGLGIAIHLGPLSVYGMSDNMLGNYNWQNTHYTNFRFGLNLNIGNRFDRDNDGIPDKKDKCKKIPGTRIMYGCPDKDLDKVADHEDECPTVKGSAKTKGCPDKDGDGVKDMADSCVSVKGDSSLNGCPDKDGDRIPDYKDACPDVKGVAYLFGCPDSDGDSISDDKDACPNLFGDALNKGCPDADGDGVTDNLDSCVTMKGLPQFNGCPDTDNDQVPDHIDNCPLEPGSIQKMGCPQMDTNAVILTPEEKKVINEAFSNLEFQSGTAQIAEKSLPSLVELAALLALRTAYNLEINGHTDNVGNAAKNLKLSQNRAVAVKDFIASKGVDYTRIKAKGFGSKKPIASNKTADGRQKNRRVEFKIVKSQS
jgi:outer membrane protein OmpA-like peptidoglycan-associated protein